MSTAVARPRHRRPEPVRPAPPSPARWACSACICGATASCFRCGCCCFPSRWRAFTSAASRPCFRRAAQRAAFAARSWPAPRSARFYGNVYNDSVGAVGIWKAGVFHALIAVAVILTVIRHTRAEEETGRAELLDSTAVGRYANLTAALILTFGASIATGLIGTAGLLTTDVPPGGFAGLRPRARRFRSGVLRRRCGGGAAEHRRAHRARNRVRRARRRLRAAGGRRCEHGHPVVVLAAGLVAAGAPVRG